MAGVVVLAAVVGLGAAPADGLAQAGPRANQWTRQLTVDLSARRLGVPGNAPAARLARAALERHAARLGLRGSLRALRLDRRLRAPARDGARELRQLRFQQTVRGARVVWSQIDVTIAAGTVSTINATVVPVKPGLATGQREIGRRRALTIARRAVPGAEDVLQPLRVAYAGKPTTRTSRRRAARRAWLVETMPASQLAADEHDAQPLCIIVDADTGKVIGRWWGTAAHPDRAPNARAAQAARSRTAQAATGPLMLEAFDGQSPGQGIYARIRTTGDPRPGRNWPLLDQVQFFRPRTTDMDKLTANAENVARTICTVRNYCGKRGGSTGTYHHWEVIGNVTGTSHMNRTFLQVFIARGDTVPLNSFNDVVAHEFGHVTDLVYAGDRIGTTYQSREAAEALADMFAYDYDRADATIGEETGPVKLDFGNPAAGGRPAHMRNYVTTPNRDLHLNSTILSHAYYLFVQRVGHATAGNVLQFVPWQLSPNPTFLEVRNAFVNAAGDLYPHDDPADADTTPEVRENAIAAFNLVGIPFTVAQIP